MEGQSPQHSLFMNSDVLKQNVIVSRYSVNHQCLWCHRETEEGILRIEKSAVDRMVSSEFFCISRALNRPERAAHAINDKISICWVVYLLE